MAFNLSGRKYLVTGAGRGIGRALSKVLSEQGCKVYALSRSKEPLDSLAAECSNIKPIQADIRNWEEFRAKLMDIEPLDGLVNNAGDATLSGPSLDVPKEYLAQRIDLQLLRPINAIQMVGKKMVDAKKPGSIVNVSSVLSKQGLPQHLAYNITKAGLDMVTKQFALELGPHKIRVNSINPTLVLTDILKGYIANGMPIDRMVLVKQPIKRLPELNEIVSPILYLLSDHSSMVSGTTHIIDGGLMASFVTGF